MGRKGAPGPVRVVIVAHALPVGFPAFDRVAPFTTLQVPAPNR